MDKRWYEGKSFLFAVLGVVLTIYFGYFIFLANGITGDKFTGVRQGSFGDAFGSLNVLFSSLAFFGVVSSLILQRADLRRSHQQEVKVQFDANFYNRLSLQQNVVDRLDLVSSSTGDTTATGRDCIKKIFRYMKRSYIRTRPGLSHERRLERSYNIVWRVYQSDLSIYFRSLYSLLKFVSSSGGAEKAEYGVVVRSLLSDYELVIIFYNCLHPRGENFRKFAEEFALFDNLDLGLLIDESDVLGLPKGSFGKNKDAQALFEKRRTCTCY
ncbi:putative phage abortive infection protein [Pseudomonas germanica]|uniref:putative phage abortive infection protein n=1 Tax=Pseudomonas germanica TaxID=2815720 RepID=UPI002A4E2B66|nr:putative phage abortive infection protein [Pseudomonas germanica]WPN77133.1 putative phage abortive infection protein [Pseudomonas germanica]